MLKAPSKTIEKTEIEHDNNRSDTLVYILIGIIICLTIVIFTLLLSPSPLPTPTSGVEKKITQDENKQTIKRVIDTDGKREEIEFNEKIEIDWMIKKIDAENNKIPIWAVDDYKIALEFEKKADAYKNNKKYHESEINYKKAIDKIDDILSNKEFKFNELIIQGNSYLDDEKLEQAKLVLLQAQSIDTENKVIIRSLERIENRSEVTNLYNHSLNQEQDNKLDEAIESLKKAKIIEPEYEKINKKLSELTAKKNKIEFDNLISQILEAIDNNDLRSAEKIIKIAKSMNAMDPITGDLEKIVIEKNKNNEIIRFQRNAINQEKNEQWKKAKNSYEKILQFDSNASKAIVSLERVNAYIQLNKLMDVIILQPARLQNEKILKKSKKSLQFVKNELKQKDNLYHINKKTKREIPGLINKINSVEKIIKNASILVDVIIKSDNATEVTIYKVGKLGKITEKKLQLRSGKYTVVGSRPGYRDYRETFNISATDRAVLINVSCREKI